MMSLGTILLILLTGVAAGFLSVVSGGGSLLTLPLLIFLGLPSAVANGTNRVALAIQNIFAMNSFKRKGYFDLKLGLKLAIPAMLGSIIGAKLAIDIPDDLFNKILAAIMIGSLFLILKKPAKPAESLASSSQDTVKNPVTSIIAFFFVGLYGGFIHAGIGFIIIVTLSMLSDMSLVKISCLKIFVIFFYMLTSLCVFIINGKVNWIIGLTLAVGNTTGGLIGSHFVLTKGDRWVRIVLIITISVLTAKLLGVFNLFKL